MWVKNKIFYPYKNYFQNFVALLDKSLIICFIFYSLFILYIQQVIDRFIRFGTIDHKYMIMICFILSNVLPLSFYLLRLRTTYEKIILDSDIKLKGIQHNKIYFKLFNFFILLLVLTLISTSFLKINWLLISLSLLLFLLSPYIFVIPLCLLATNEVTKIIHSMTFTPKSYVHCLSVILFHLVIFIVFYISFCSAPIGIMAYLIITNPLTYTTGMLLGLFSWLNFVMVMMFLPIYARISLLLFLEVNTYFDEENQFQEILKGSK